MLKSRTTYQASLSLRSAKRGAAGGETGFDSVQMRERRDGKGGDVLDGKGGDELPKDGDSGDELPGYRRRG